MKRFLLEKGPFVRSVDEGKISSTRMMYDVVIALLPIVIFGFVLNGLMPFINGKINAWFMLKPLVNVIVGILCSMIFEGLYFLCFLKVRGFKNILKSVNLSYAMIPGLILALLLPVRTPLYVIVFGCFMANIVFKMLFGGLGHNIFNPALVGYGVAFAAFGSIILAAGKEQVGILSETLKITASSTPLGAIGALASGIGSYHVTYAQVVEQFGGLLNLFIGFKAGALGEVSGLLCLVGFIYLVCRKVINWRVPVIYVGTVFILTWIIGIVNGVDGPLLGIWFPTFHILTGGLLFGAVFMATEPVTTPKSPNGKVIFAIALAVLTVLVRLVAGPEGVGTSILFVCLFTPIIDKFAARNRGPVITSKIVLNYVLLFLFFAAIVVYTVYKTTALL